MRVIFFLLLLLLGCQKKTTVTHFEGEAFTHSYTIQVSHALTSCEKQEIVTFLDSLFEQTDLYLNHWNPSSELSLINRLEIGTSHVLSNELQFALQKAKELTILTEGHFNPTLGAAIKAWKKALKNQIKPTCSSSSGWEAFTFASSWITRTKNDVQIDLDGFLKGLMTDRIAEKLCKMGFSDFLINFSGDLKAFGHHPSGRCWQIKLPYFKNEIISLQQAFASSGVEAQNALIDGKKCTHIIDPNTHEPFLFMHSVSVSAPTCLFADALATALMTFSSFESATHFLNRHQEAFKGCTFWMQNQEGEIKKWISN